MSNRHMSLPGPRNSRHSPFPHATSSKLLSSSTANQLPEHRSITQDLIPRQRPGRRKPLAWDYQRKPYLQQACLGSAVLSSDPRVWCVSVSYLSEIPAFAPLNTRQPTPFRRSSNCRLLSLHWSLHQFESRNLSIWTCERTPKANPLAGAPSLFQSWHPSSLSPMKRRIR